jgi:hypothetical protein
VLDGSCRLTVDGHHPLTLEAGDFVLLLSGGLLMVTSPVRSAWSSPELPARAPVLALLPAVPAGVWETGGGQGLRR